MDSKININKINELLSQGLVPSELFYVKEKKIIIDPEMVDYNLYPVETIYDKIINDVNSMNISPLEEYKKIKSI